MATNNFVFDRIAYRNYCQSKQTKVISEKKKTEFNSLLRRAIKNELSKVDAEILDMYFFKGFSQQEIADMFGVNQSTVNRRINKSLDILYDRLKYAAEYRFGIVIEKRC